MMLEIIAVASPIAFTIVGGYIHLWVKSVSTEVQIKGLIDLVNERFDNVEEKFDDTNWRLQRIEKSMNGHLKDII